MRLFRLISLITCLALVALAAAGLMAPAASAQDAGTVRVRLEARMTEASEAIGDGVHWRIFGVTPGENGQLPLLGEATGGARAFDITPGYYLVHAAYGFASTARRLSVAAGAATEVFNLEAGAMQLNGATEVGSRVPAGLVRFDVYAKTADSAPALASASASATDANAGRTLVARNIRSDEIVPFPAGTYHVVSRYGTINAETRADIRVEAGKVTQATILHRAARVSLRLVRAKGGDAIADTAWSVITEAGEVVTESTSAFPAFVLTEGNYTAIAKNAEKTFSRDFEVISGIDQEVEVVLE